MGTSIKGTFFADISAKGGGGHNTCPLDFFFIFNFFCGVNIIYLEFSEISRLSALANMSAKNVIVLDGSPVSQPQFGYKNAIF